MTEWNPAGYLQFGDERGRPFIDLTARIVAAAPRRVADLGCGPGNLTALLAARWPDAEIEGVDASPAMIARAQEHATDRLDFAVGDLRAWRPAEPPDVIISNATLQWVPNHRDVLLHELADQPRYAAWTRDVERPAAYGPEVYLADLAALGCQVQAWETTYLHVLDGPDPVFRWISATGARPVLGALPEGVRQEFEARYKRLLIQAYPPQPYGTVLPFRRVFAVARTDIA
jgi:trans-aconitate 2-methyltransferase